MSRAWELWNIFGGCERGHGEYKITSLKGAKHTGEAATKKGPATEALWESHLNGTLGLGVVPITERNNCRWAAVDIDDYEGLDLEDLSMKLPAPLILCRSKSGGAHIYLFTSEPVPCKLIRKKMALVARALGQPNAEIFPKQNELDEKGIGNWINMPYFNEESTTRYCLKAGLVLSTQEFIDLIKENSVTLAFLSAYNPDAILSPDADNEFADAPPCLEYLTKNGFPLGSRNNGLFNMGVYARKKFPTDWKEKVVQYNVRFMTPGSYEEVQSITRSISERNYKYRCNDQPILAYCNKEECVHRTYGVFVKENEKDKRPNVLDDVESVICFNPAKGSHDEPYWVFTIAGIEFNATADMIRSQALFTKEYLCRFHKMVLPIKDVKWAERMNELLENASMEKLAPDAGPIGQMMVHLEDFCCNKAKAKAKSEMLLGKPWHDEGRIFFRSNDFMKYLDQQRYRALKDTEIFRVLKTKGALHHAFNLKGKHVTCWSIPEFPTQTEGFESEKISDVEKY